MIQCGVEESEGSRKDLQTMAQRKTSIFLTTLNISSEGIDWEEAFERLGADWKFKAKVFVSHNAVGVRKMRLSRGQYKCDSKGGQGFRFDLFF